MTHLTTDVMFSGQQFAILAMFLVDRLRDFCCVERLHDFVCGEVVRFLCVDRLSNFSHSLTQVA